MNGLQELNDLILAASQPDNKAAVSRLLKEIPNTDIKLLKEAATRFNEMFESWDESVFKDPDKGAVSLALAEKSVLDTSTFRIALNSAIRQFLPPYLSSTAVTRAAGARDNSVPVCDVAQRIRKLQHLKTNAYLYQMGSRTWARIINIDKVLATIAVSTFATGGQVSIPLSSALSGCYFFEPNLEMTNIINITKSQLKPAAYYQEKLHLHSLGELSETKTREIIQQLVVPKIMSPADFDTWWNAKAAEPAEKQNKRSFRDARSILELQILTTTKDANNKVKDLPPEELVITEEDAVKLSRLFNHVRPGMSAKDLEMLASCMAKLANSAEESVLHTLFDGTRGNVPFFPAEISADIPLKNLEIWGQIPMRYFPGFLQIAELLYNQLEIAKLAMILPLRCINAIFEKLSLNDIADAIFAVSALRSDVLLAIWKNRKTKKYKDICAKIDKNKEITDREKKYKDLCDEITSVISMVNVCHALSEENLPKEWAAAQRELKTTLFEKDDFQKFILENAGTNIPSIVSSIQRMRNMAPGECQSLLVKLARHSVELTEYIESGKGSKLLAAQNNSQAQKQREALMTSMKSYKGLLAELDNIIRVQIPDNNKQIEIARGFGDFSENAEYDAAKERRRFLHRRRSELETLVATIQPLNFLEFTADTSKVSMGTQVTIQDPSGAEKVYSIVGAWDGNPDRNLVSYKTKFGEALLGAKPGDTVTLPDGSSVTVKAVGKLADDLARELSPAE